MAWSNVKGYVKTNNSTFKINDVRRLLNEGIERVTPEMWSNYVSHTIKEEDKFWQIDYISDEMLDEHTIQHVLTITGLTTSDSEDSD
ncbi:DDE 3 domain-containing protein [Aphis craccivora]|uniref:DDE 3 domain-containing protein n=1 Tax=Aphis craccivora TaxID=307492 RepID=A0A6G0YY53_APHCR|nr:DDE 3 domain-containing protein [Aphis craccivora]